MTAGDNEKDIESCGMVCRKNWQKPAMDENGTKTLNSLFFASGHMDVGAMMFREIHLPPDP